MLGRIIELFKPEDFKNNFYGWLTNQISHVAFSGGLMVMLWILQANVVYSAIALSLFWCLWELRHYVISKNLKDCFQDLFFEISGVIVFICPYYIFVLFGLFIISILKHTYKK